MLLADGRLEEGFALYEGRFTRLEGQVKKPPMSYAEWDGRPVERLLVWPEQGVGDQILHARWIVELAKRGVRVSLLCLPPVARLFSTLPAQLIVQAGRVSVPRHDAWAMIGSLAHRCGASLETLPSRAYLSGRGAVGAPSGGIEICWRGDPRFPGNVARSLSEPATERLLKLGRSLLPEDTGAKDFQETADIIAGLDLVITVDTSIANLAGAMGKTVWVLLAKPCDWRWMVGRSDSPWYPSARLFRQPQSGDWDTVLDEVERELDSRA
ncbi:MAG TPA: hypothetical protein VIO94_12335 [Phenylobacterium sp.]